MDSKKILDSVKLPTLSKTLYKIIELEKQNPISILKDAKTIVEKDPLFSAHILKVANSPLYGFSQQVRTISHAIGLLGIKKVRSIAFAFSIFDFLKRVKYQPQFGLIFTLILKKALLFSAVSTILAQRMEHIDSDELYLSGLLADIGQLIFFLHSPAKYREIYSSRDVNLIPKEKDLFGITHIDMGREFCSRWNFPDFIQLVIKNHYELESSETHSRLAFITNQIVELLLTERDEDRAVIFKKLENHSKTLLRLSLSEVEDTIRKLPEVMETYISDFPEVQEDLDRVIEMGSSLIISLMKKKMDMVILAQELSITQKKLAKEKVFLSHMLNLSYFLSSLMAPQKIISSLFEYFKKFIKDFSIEFIYKLPGSDNGLLMKGDGDEKGKPFPISDYSSLVKAKISNEAIRLEDEEITRLEKEAGKISLVFPISYHHNLFGYFLMDVDEEQYAAFDLEMSYIQILVNIVANSFQNYHSFVNLKKETDKKEMVTRELFKFDRELEHFKHSLVEVQKSEIVGEMLPVIFHKLKNKLTPILGYAQILLAKVDDDGIQKRIKKIEKNANELAEQLNQLRDYFKFEEQPREKENLNLLLHRLEPNFNLIEEKESITVELDLDSTVPDDHLIPGQIEALVINIIDNAVLAIKEKRDLESGAIGVITIKTVGGKDSYSLIIRDNGVGMDENGLSMIWAPFYSEFEGKVGLGLTLCEKVLSNHEASYEVDSSPGEFTEFRITFKFEPGDDDSYDQPDPNASGLHAKILIVDDEAYLVDLMKEILLNEGNFDITVTTSGEEAIRHLEESYDLLISDIRMPDVSGMDVYNSLKDKKHETRVIMVTADPFSADVADFLRENQIEYLKKPFELMEFKKRVLDKLS